MDVAQIAPEAFVAWGAAMASARRTVDSTLYALARARIANLLGTPAPTAEPILEGGDKLAGLSSWPTSPMYTDADRACLDLAEQFVIDVSKVSPEQRKTLANALGDQASEYVFALYTVDFELRMRAAFSQLFGTDPLVSDPVGSTPDLRTALTAVLTTIARLTSLDPMTTEIVRLRGARTHNCRRCQSLRNVRAVDGGGDETTFDKIDFYEQSDLTPRHKVALRLTDAIIWQPASFPAGLSDEVHDNYTPEQVVELILDVTRNAINKTSVAMGTDGRGVGDGLEYYDIGTDGDLVYGLTPRT